jgi:F-type H+-transporting ATPase subunit a
LFAAVEFPPIENIVEWPNWFGSGALGFNKIAFIGFLAFAISVAMFLLASAKYKTRPVPSGIQNIVESTVEFVEKQVILPTIGPDGMGYLPLLMSMFLFIFIGNIFEVIPTAHMPANARMANPLVLTIITYVVFIGTGIKHNGLKYFTSTLFPPGVPKALYILVTPIELISTFFVRPFSLAVRLFANMLAGHILLITFSVLTISLFTASLLVVVSPFSFFMLVAFTGFEIMVAFLQAYIFTLLTGVYIGGAIHPAH